MPCGRMFWASMLGAAMMNNRLFRLCSLLLLGLALTPGLASARQDSDKTSCVKGETNEERIAACSRIIDRGERESRDERSAAFVNRAYAYTLDALGRTNQLVTPDGASGTLTQTVVRNIGILLLDPTGQSLTISGNAVLNLTNSGGGWQIAIGAPAPPPIGAQMYARATLTKMIAKYTQGNESIDKVMAWAASELEGFMRS